MKTKIKIFAALLSLIFTVTAFAACSKGKSTTLGEPAALSSPDYVELAGEGYETLQASAKTFSFNLSSMSRTEKTGISPYLR